MQSNFENNLNSAIQRIGAINNLAMRLVGSPITYETSVKASFKSVCKDLEERKNIFKPIVEEAAKENNISPKIISAVIEQESGFDPNAKSRCGAMGLMQLMPETAKALGVDPSNPEENIKGGSKYLASLLNLYHGNLTLALSAYNSGPNNVNKYGGVPPFKETQNYVKSIMKKIS